MVANIPINTVRSYLLCLSDISAEDEHVSSFLNECLMKYIVQQHLTFGVFVQSGLALSEAQVRQFLSLKIHFIIIFLEWLIFS